MTGVAAVMSFSQTCELRKGPLHPIAVVHTPTVLVYPDGNADFPVLVVAALTHLPKVVRFT